MNFKVILLMVAMTALFVLAGGALGGTTGMLAAFAIAALMNRFAWFGSDQAALRAYGARLMSQ